MSCTAINSQQNSPTISICNKNSHCHPRELRGVFFTNSLKYVSICYPADLYTVLQAISIYNKNKHFEIAKRLGFKPIQHTFVFLNGGFRVFGYPNQT